MKKEITLPSTLQRIEREDHSTYKMLPSASAFLENNKFKTIHEEVLSSSENAIQIICPEARYSKKWRSAPQDILIELSDFIDKQINADLKLSQPENSIQKYSVHLSSSRGGLQKTSTNKCIVNLNLSKFLTWNNDFDEYDISYPISPKEQNDRNENPEPTVISTPIEIFSSSAKIIKISNFQHPSISINCPRAKAIVISNNEDVILNFGYDSRMPKVSDNVIIEGAKRLDLSFPPYFFDSLSFNFSPNELSLTNWKKMEAEINDFSTRFSDTTKFIIDPETVIVSSKFIPYELLPEQTKAKVIFNNHLNVDGKVEISPKELLYCLWKTKFNFVNNILQDQNAFFEKSINKNKTQEKSKEKSYN